MSLFESAVRDDLNKRAQRVSAVLNPVKLVITNFPDDAVEVYQAQNNPENEADGTHEIEFSRELWIERDDFMEDAPKKFFRLGPGKEVRLKNSYIIRCPEENCCKKDAEKKDCCKKKAEKAGCGADCKKCTECKATCSDTNCKDCKHKGQCKKNCKK
jgi:glutaminyl-tRNA synthetase